MNMKSLKDSSEEILLMHSIVINNYSHKTLNINIQFFYITDVWRSDVFRLCVNKNSYIHLKFRQR